MRINELLVESEIQEGPFTQAIGRGAGKLARGVANIGKDLKTGFQSGYKDTPEPAAAAKKTGAQPNLGKATAMGMAQGAAKALRIKDPTKDAAAKPAAPTAATPAPAAAPSAATTAAPAADPQQIKMGVGQINKIIPTLRTRDLISLKKNLDAVIATKQKQPKAKPAAPTAATPAAKPAAKPAADELGRVEPTMDPVDAKQAADDARKDDLFGKGVRPKTKDERRAAFRAQNEKQGLTKKKPSQAQIDADRERVMGTTTDSVIRTGNSLAESLAQRVAYYTSKEV